MKGLAAAALVAGGLLGGSVGPVSAATYSLTELTPLAGDTITFATAINDSGVAVGGQLGRDTIRHR